LTSFHGADGAASRHGISQQWPSVRGNDDRLRLADASEFRVWAFAFRFLNSVFCILYSAFRLTYRKSGKIAYKNRYRFREKRSEQIASALLPLFCNEVAFSGEGFLRLPAIESDLHLCMR